MQTQAKEEEEEESKHYDEAEASEFKDENYFISDVQIVLKNSDPSSLSSINGIQQHAENNGVPTGAEQREPQNQKKAYKANYILSWGEFQHHIKMNYLLLNNESDEKTQSLEEVRQAYRQKIEEYLKSKERFSVMPGNGSLVPTGSAATAYNIPFIAYDEEQFYRYVGQISGEGKESRSKYTQQQDGPSYSDIVETVLALSKNPQLLAQMLVRNDKTLEQRRQDRFVENLAHMSLENILSQNPYEQPFMLFLTVIIRNELYRIKNSADLFVERTLSSCIFCQFMRKVECKIFIQQIMRDYVLDIVKTNEKISIDPKSIYDQIEMESRKNILSQIKKKEQKVKHEEVQRTQSHMPLYSNGNGSTNADILNRRTGAQNTPQQESSLLKRFGQRDQQDDRKGGEKVARSDQLVPLKERETLNSTMKGESTNGKIRQTELSTNVQGGAQQQQGSGENSRLKELNSIQLTDIIGQLENGQNFVKNPVFQEIAHAKGCEVVELSLSASQQAETQIDANIVILKRLVKGLMQQVLNHFHQIPKFLKIICKIVVCLLREKDSSFQNEVLFQKSEDVSGNHLQQQQQRESVRPQKILSENEKLVCHLMSQILFQYWINAELLYEVDRVNCQEHNKVQIKNVNQVCKVAVQIFRCVEFPANHKEGLHQLNDMIRMYRDNVIKFYNRLLKTECHDSALQLMCSLAARADGATETPQYTHQLTCACLSLGDVLVMCQAAVRSHELHPCQSKTANVLVQRCKKLETVLQQAIIPQSNSSSIKRERQGMLENLYIFFWLPSPALRSNYLDAYMKFEINQRMEQKQIFESKIKNMLLCFLVKIQSIYTILKLMNQESMSLEQIIQMHVNNNHKEAVRQKGLDNVPIHIYANYLLSLIKKMPASHTFDRMLVDLQRDLNERLHLLHREIIQTKQDLSFAKQQLSNEHAFLTSQQRDSSMRHLRHTLLLYLSRAQYPVILRFDSTTVTVEQKDQAVPGTTTSQLHPQQQQQQQQQQNTSQNKQQDTTAQPPKILNLTQYKTCNTVKEFIEKFCSLEVVCAAVRCESIDEEYSEIKNNVQCAYESYLDIIQKNLEKDPELMRQLRTQLPRVQVTEILDRYITRCIYKRICDGRLQTDIQIQQILERFHGIGNFDFIPHLPKVRADSVLLWEEASDIIRKIDSQKTPLEKMQMLARAEQCMTNTLQICESQSLSGDLLTPYMQMVIINSRVKRAATNLNFIQCFALSMYNTGASNKAVVDFQTCLQCILGYQNDKVIKQLLFQQQALQTSKQLNLTPSINNSQISPKQGDLNGRTTREQKLSPNTPLRTVNLGKQFSADELSPQPLVRVLSIEDEYAAPLQPPSSPLNAGSLGNNALNNIFQSIPNKSKPKDTRRN